MPSKMGSSEKFCLRWNDWTTHLTSIFHDLRYEADFFDVTLASDDHQEVQAHQLVLSACSPWFKSALQRHGGRRAGSGRDTNLVLYLRGIPFRHIQAILNFVYYGEVNVEQDELNDFLEVAEELSIKGLTAGDQDGEGQTPSARGGGGKPTAKRPRGPSFTPSVPAKKVNKSLYTPSSSSGSKPSTSASSAIEVKQETLNVDDLDPDLDLDDGGQGAGDDYDDYDDEDYTRSGSAKKRKSTSAGASRGGGGASGSGDGYGSFGDGQGDDDDQGNSSFHFSRKVSHRIGFSDHFTGVKRQNPSRIGETTGIFRSQPFLRGFEHRKHLVRHTSHAAFSLFLPS